MKILLVEDDKKLAEIFKQLIDSAGNCSTTICYDGDSVISEINDHEFDLIFCDLMIPGISGSRLVTLIQENQPKTTLIILSNLGSGDEYEIVKGMQVAEIIMKVHTGPDEIKELVNKYRP
jgi:DNA-binding response OmpR family regulator